MQKIIVKEKFLTKGDKSKTIVKRYLKKVSNI